MFESAAGQVAGLFICPGHRLPMRAVSTAQAVADLGLLGDAHARLRSSRQVLLMSQDVLAELDLHPGDVKENITTSSLDLMALRRGQRLRVGEAVLEIAAECEPCERMDEVRPGLQQELLGRRGMLARVVGSGVVRVGDPIRAVSAAEARAGGEGATVVELAV